MKPDRWSEVERVYHGASARPAGERAAFLAEACAGDEALRREVESLLAEPASASAFLDGDAAAVAAQLVSNGDASVLTGRRIGAYHVHGLLGAGGMGEVYRARDTTLEREVAIKILPRHFTSAPERLARFEREARMLASLNHPHIGAIYGVEAWAGGRALVLELVEGPTLADRLSTGPISLAESLGIARQIADALEAAHAKGIVHRDLKPANIKITPDGIVKVLDFGLAKVAERDGAGALSQTPTVTVGGTREGVIVGTAAYMSPEQARGLAVDTRTDIWAFGCVLYEMLAGARAFDGKDVTDTLAALLKSEPDWSRLAPATPPSINRLLKRCLVKDVKRRLQHIGDARLELEDAESRDAAAAFAASPRRLPSIWSVTALVASLVIGAMGMTWLRAPDGRSDQPPAEVIRTFVSVAPADQLGATPTDQGAGEGRPGRTAMVFSPDGRSLVFSAIRGNQQQLYLRRLTQLEATPIGGTENAHSPFFSPDGQWLGFWSAGPGSGTDSLFKVAFPQGGPTAKICDAPPIFGASWGADDTVVFAQRTGGLWRVPAAGGNAEPLTTLDTTHGEFSHRLPLVLPGSRAVLFTVTHELFARWDATAIAVQALATGERKILIEGGADARYVPTGHLVYMRRGTLMAVPFNLQRLEVTGNPVAVAADVMQAANAMAFTIDSGAGQFSVSASGTLVYLPGGVLPAPERSLHWVDRTGAERPVGVPSRPYTAVRLSPDGQRFIFGTLVGTLPTDDRNLWISDILRGGVTRLTDGRSEVQISSWAPDGKRIAFGSMKGNRTDIVVKPVDGTGPIERLTTRDSPAFVHAWTPDGSTLAFIEQTVETGNDIWVLPLSGDREPHPILRTRFNEAQPEFSPDGSWLAYTSDESGRQEVYVQPYPGPGNRQPISTDGGREPVWSRNGRELFFMTLPQGNLTRMMAVPVTTGPTLVAGTPHTLFEGPYVTQNIIRLYNVAPDGSRFLLIRRVERPPLKLTQMILVQHWFEELKRRVPMK